MNKGIFKKIMISIPALLLVFLSGCLKSHDGFVDLTQTSDFIILANSGLANFKAANINVNKDTVKSTITVDLASKDNSNGAVTVTIGIDAAAMDAYNSANGTNYKPLPAAAYKLLDTKLTVPAGQHYATTTLEVYRSKIDPTVSYMVPISITDGGGKALSSNQNTIYFNIIGNPIAGQYNWDFTRWGNPSQSGSPDITFTGHTTSFVADNPTQVEVPSGYYIGPRYVISFTNTNGTLSNFKVSMNADDVATMAAAGVVITVGPKITKADPITGEYIFEYTTLTRYVIDRYYK